MFGIGFPEMVIIVLLLIMVVGPEQLPAVLKKGFSLIKEARRHISEITSEIDKQTEPLRQPFEEIVAQVKEEEKDIVLKVGSKAKAKGNTDE